MLEFLLRILVPGKREPFSHLQPGLRYSITTANFAALEEHLQSFSEDVFTLQEQREVESHGDICLEGLTGKVDPSC